MYIQANCAILHQLGEIGSKHRHAHTDTRHTARGPRACPSFRPFISNQKVDYDTSHYTRHDPRAHTLTSCTGIHECSANLGYSPPTSATPHKYGYTSHARTVFRVRRGAYSRVQRAVHRDASPLHAARCARHAHAPLVSLYSRFSASTCYLEFELMPLAVAPIPLSERGRSGTRHTGPSNPRKWSGGRTAPRRATWG